MGTEDQKKSDEGEETLSTPPKAPTDWTGDDVIVDEDDGYND